MSTTTFHVTGMTCGHCVSSVSAEVSAVTGVTDVQVELATGLVTVTSERPVGTSDVRAAVEQAGYQLSA